MALTVRPMASSHPSNSSRLKLWQAMLLMACIAIVACTAELQPAHQDAKHKQWRRLKQGLASTSPADPHAEKWKAQQLEERALSSTASPATLGLARGRRSVTSSTRATTSNTSVFTLALGRGNTRVGLVSTSSTTLRTTTTTTRPASSSSSRTTSTTRPASTTTRATSTSTTRPASTTSTRPTTTTTSRTSTSTSSTRPATTSSVASTTSRTTSSTSTRPTSTTSTRPTSATSTSTRATTTTSTRPSSTSTRPTTTSTRPTTTSTRPSSTSSSSTRSTSGTAASSATTRTTQSGTTNTVTTVRPSTATSTTTRPTSSSTTSRSSSISVTLPSATTSVPPIPVPPTTSTTNTCAPSYTDGQTTVTGTGTLPKPTSFVAKNGLQLQLDGRPYRIVGPNAYWLGLDENINPTNYPSKARIREAMAIAVAMGANTIRSHTLGISVGNALSVEPSLDVFNEAAFDIIDYALFAAREYGLRVIIPFSDEYDYYHGGKYTFLRWTNTSSEDRGAMFYTNPTVMLAFKRYINRIITRYNPYSQTYYYNDPTILAWETGNEYGGYIGRYGYPPLSFTDTIAGYIKGLDSRHLVVDGTNGFWNYTTRVVAPGVNSSNIDIMTDHLYPLNNPLMAKEQEIVTQYRKAFLIGEYDWTGLYGGNTNLSSFLAAVEATNYIGDMPWNVMGHDDQCCRYVVHNDGYSIYYPNGNPSLAGNVLQIVQHWYRMTGRTPPATLPGVACPQKAF